MKQITTPPFKVLVDTKANILATTPDAGKLAYATDTTEFYLYDGTNWKVAPLELETESSNPDMGAYNETGLGTSDKMGYDENYITDKSLSNVRILQNALTQEGAIRTTTAGVFQIYLNSKWNDVVINFVLREDSTEGYEYEHKPVGFTEWIEIMSGNSNTKDLDGKPLIQQYTSSMGAYQPDLQLEGGSF